MSADERTTWTVAGAPVERCRTASCQAPVVFAVGESGLENPIEPESVENGNVRLVERLLPVLDEATAS